MFRRLRALILFALLALVAVPATGQERVWTQTGESVAGWQFVEASIRAYMQTKGIRGAVIAASHKGRLIYARGFTWDSPEVEPVLPTSIFRIASMSKPITSVAIHQLIERGLLNYDTRVIDILGLQPHQGTQPDPWLEEVTIDHLLYHIGGWDRDVAYDPMFQDSVIAATLGVDLPISKYDIATYMSGQRMQDQPGDHFAYSNYGYALLGMIIEEITGCDYSEWVAENIFQPIGVGRPRRGHTLAQERAPGEVFYYSEPNGQSPYRWNIENMDAHGGWILAAPDYLQFMSAIFQDPGNSPLLERTSIEAMVRVNPATAGVSYARGWSVYQDGAAMVFGHSGGLPGTVTNARWQSGGLAFVVLLNTSGAFGSFDIDDPFSLPLHDLFESVGIVPGTLGTALAESWIPVVAKSGGSGNSFWISDVGLLNRSTLSNKVHLRFQMLTLARDYELELAPGEQRLVADVVSAFELEGSGSLRVFSSEPLTITSRTYNFSTEGTFGQFLGASTGPGGLKKGESAVLMHLREDVSARSNIGILNAGRRETTVSLKLFDGSGTEISSFIRKIEPRQTTQLNQPFTNIGGRNDVSVGYARITVIDGEEVIAYGSVVDVGTGDPTTIPMKTGDGFLTQWVAAAAHSEGASGSFWLSDLGLLNNGVSALNATVFFHSASGSDRLFDLNLEAGEHKLLEDVVGMLGASGSGSIYVVADQPVFVSSRTYNDSETGTFGQYLDGYSDTGMVSAGALIWLPQLMQNVNFRTNIGLLNTGTLWGRVVVRLYDADGSMLSTTPHVIAAGQRLQLQEPFERFAGRTDIESGYAIVEVSSGSKISAYASVIDNRTNDPTTIPMMP